MNVKEQRKLIPQERQVKTELFKGFVLDKYKVRTDLLTKLLDVINRLMDKNIKGKDITKELKDKKQIEQKLEDLEMIEAI